MRSEIKLERLGRLARKYRSRKSGPALRWPEEIQDQAMSLAKSGVGFSAISQATGIAIMTLKAWKGRSEKKPVRGGFRKLKVVDRPKSVRPSKSPVKMFVTTVQGSEIHGLSPTDIAELVRKGIL